jgi:hypothetical protein
MLIKKLDIETDSTRIMDDLSSILNQHCPWPINNQIGIKYRNGAENIWTDAIGMLTYNKRVGEEIDYVNWCLDTNFYVRQEIEKLQDTLKIKTGRIRFMKMLPKTGLTVHYDSEVRYHLALQTNPYAHFGFRTEPVITDICDLPNTGITFHLPKDNHWYRADTTKFHWVFNGGKEERIHLVVNQLTI